MGMERIYCFAGVEYTLVMPETRFPAEERYLAPFRVESVSDPHIFRFSFVDTLDAPEGSYLSTEPGFCVYAGLDFSLRYMGSVQDSWKNAYMRVLHKGKQHEIQVLNKTVPGRIGSHTVLNALALEHLVPEIHGFVFHSSYIQWEGKAILFTAPSGTGKSTQADLWQQFRAAEIINGDRSVVRRVGDGVMAEGIPFAGSSQYCRNESLPLAAIVYLEQAPKTAIRKMRGYEAFSRIWEGVSVNTWDKQDMMLVSDAVKFAAETVPVFHLACTPDESAVIALENALRK